MQNQNQIMYLHRTTENGDRVFTRGTFLQKQSDEEMKVSVNVILDSVEDYDAQVLENKKNKINTTFAKLFIHTPLID